MDGAADDPRRLGGRLAHAHAPRPDHRLARAAAPGGGRSRVVLRRLFHVPVDFFCYPSGAFDPAVIAAVRRAGYLGATTTLPGLARPRSPTRCAACASTAASPRPRCSHASRGLSLGSDHRVGHATGVDDLILLGDNLELLPRFADGAFRHDLPRSAVQHRPRAQRRGRCGPSPTRTATAPASAAAATAPSCSSARPTATRSTTTSASSSRACATPAACSTREGTLYLHLDYREAHYVKVLCDELFGRECFLNEIIWAYDYGGKPRRRWPAKHDTILVYVRDPDRYWFDSDAVEREPYMAPGLVTPEKAARGKLPTDCWWHTIVPTSGSERTGYPTQKPEGIVRRMVQASTQPGDRVADFFAGSGTLGAVAAALGRRYVLIDATPRRSRSWSGGWARPALEHSDAARRCRPPRRPRCRGRSRARPRRAPPEPRAASAAGIGPVAAAAVEDRVALVGDERPAVGAAPRRLPARSRSSRSHTGRANSTTSTGRGARSPSRATSLRLVGDDHHQPRRRSATTFSRRCAPPRPLIRSRPGSISSAPSMHDIERGRLARASSAGCRGSRQRRGGRVRRGHAGDVAQAPVGDPRGQRLEHHRRRRPGAEAEPHPVADVALDRLLAGGSPPRVGRAHAAIAARTAAGSVIGARQANRSQM